MTTLPDNMKDVSVGQNMRGQVTPSYRTLSEPAADLAVSDVEV